jgi:septal ring factor EnvC (AmiA/AmiB activator)
MNSVQKQAVKRNIARLKKARAIRRQEKLARQHMSVQEHFKQEENKKHLPDNPKMTIESPRHFKLCKECSLKNREHGSSRCAGCSSAYKAKQTV